MQNSPFGSGLQEILFHELHHRFYNSLQLLSANLGQLARDHPRPDDVRRLRDRIGVLGGLHRTLAEPLVQATDLKSTLQALCASVADGFDCGSVVLEVEGACLPRDPMLVRGLTLILVELVTNALKHGALDASQIHVRMSGTPDCCRLMVANPIRPSQAEAIRAPYVATRFAEAMGGTLTVASGLEHQVHVVVPTGAWPLHSGDHHDTF